MNVGSGELVHPSKSQNLAFCKYLKKNWKYNNKVYQLCIHLEQGYDSIKNNPRRIIIIIIIIKPTAYGPMEDKLYDILNRCTGTKHLVRLIKTCLDATQCKQETLCLQISH